MKKGGLKMKKIVFVLAVAMLFTVLVAAQPFAEEASEYKIIVNELVKEKVITQEKAKEILAEIKAVQQKAAKERKSFELPDSLKWLERFKFTGDLRLRYQLDKTEHSDQRHRGRIRVRFGTEVDVIDNIKVFAGIATGSGDPRSTNQTLDNTFEHPTIRLDYAYAQYQPFSWLTLKGGEIRGMPLWEPADFLWDTDINPDGVAGQLNYPLLKAKEKGGLSVNGFFNTAFFLLDEYSTREDPYMYLFQPGFDVKLKDFSLKTAVAYYGFEHVKDYLLDYSSGTNTRRTGPTRLRYGYNSLGVGTELGYEKPLGLAFIPYVALLGEYIYNPAPSTNNDGFAVGMKVGHKKVSEKGSWSAMYLYRYLERDAWLDTFPDSDALGGRTNARGHEVILQYGLFKHVSLGADYYNMIPIKGDPKNTEQVFQLDLLFWF
jgi:hypothetical protein